MITKERYEMLIESHKTGANLAPIDFEKIEEYEKAHNLPDTIKGENKMTTSEPDTPKTQNLYVYVTELLKEDAPYPDNKREAIHEIPISYGLPIELIYGFVMGELERVYTFEKSPEITGFEVTKIIFALDTVEPLTLTVTLSEFHKSPKN